MNTADLITDLKILILEATEQSTPPGGLGDEEALFGPESRLALDSLDGLEISMAIQERYGVRMVDSKVTRRALTSIAQLAQHLLERMP